MAKRGPKPRSLAERFEQYVDRSGGPDACHPWMAQRVAGGYGRIASGGKHGKPLATHRVAWALAYGPIPRGEGYHGTSVLHRCDNPPCVNPRHLFLGTQADNLADMVAKGRHGKGRAQGEAQAAAKLTDEAVREIRALGARGIPQREIARRYDVAQTTVRYVLNGRSWTHVA